MYIPLQDEGHCKEVKNRITKLFNKEELDRLPIMVDYLDLESFAEKGQKEQGEKCAKSIKDHEFDLKRQLNEMEEYLSRPFKDDRILALLPYAGTGTVASAFGCPTTFLKDGDPWTEHIIDSPDDIDKLKPNLKDAEIFNLSLEKALYFQEKVKGKIPIKLPDIQDPIDTAGIVMNDTELFIAMSTHPKKVHRLLGMVTETLIEMVERFRSKIENLFCLSHNWWLPYGIHMSNDELAVLSPEMYEEFVVPYIEIIGKKFGGVVLHSCGDYTYNARTLLKIESLMGVDFYEFPINKIAPIVNDRIVLVSGFVDNAFMTFQERANKREEELKRLSWENLESLQKVRGNRLLFTGQCFEKGRLEEYFCKAGGD